MKFFSMKKKQTQRMEPPEPVYTAATMEFLSTMMKTKTPVIVRVEPPGYSTHQFVLPASHLRSPHFASLMPNTAVEYDGVHDRIAFAITCTLDEFLHAMVNTDIRAPSPVGAEAAAPLDPSYAGRLTIGWFLARKH